MDIAVLMNAHSHPDVIIDTVESIFKYMTKNVLIIKDGAAKGLDLSEISCPIVEGFYHNCFRSPYRNMALGLSLLYERYPDCQWYCYMEYDCLVGSDRFMRNLKLAEDMGVWNLGTNGRMDPDISLSLVEALIGSKFAEVYYMLGACQFFNKRFMEKLVEIDFFNRFLHLTNHFTEGFMPNYSGYDVSEHIYPTLARYFGGNTGVFSTWYNDRWHGSYQYFPIRWKPEITEEENFPEASIIHPLKTFDHPIRIYHREKRNNASLR